MNYDNDKRTSHEIAASKISKDSRDIKAFLKRKMTSIFSSINETGDPEAVLNVFGEGAVQAIIDHKVMADACAALGLEIPTFPDGVVTVDKDGSVSVNIPEVSLDTSDVG